jgi:hypothetical protein
MAVDAVPVFHHATLASVGATRRLVWTSIWVRRIAQEELPEKSAARQSLPVMLFCLVFTIGMLWLLIG